MYTYTYDIMCVLQMHFYTEAQKLSDENQSSLVLMLKLAWHYRILPDYLKLSVKNIHLHINNMK